MQSASVRGIPRSLLVLCLQTRLERCDAEVLAQALQDKAHLRLLVVSGGFYEDGTGWTADWMARMREALPGLKIEHPVREDL